MRGKSSVRIPPTDSSRVFSLNCKVRIFIVMTASLIIHIHMLIQYPRSFQQITTDVLDDFGPTEGSI